MLSGNSLGDWEVVKAVRRGREAYAADERILGSHAFIEALRQTLRPAPAIPGAARSLEDLVQRVCARLHLPPGSLQGGGRKPAVSQARAGIAYLWTEVFGRSGRALTAVLGIRPAAVYAAARRGRAEPTRWERLVARY